MKEDSSNNPGANVGNDSSTTKVSKRRSRDRTRSGNKNKGGEKDSKDEESSNAAVLGFLSNDLTKKDERKERNKKRDGKKDKKKDTKKNSNNNNTNIKQAKTEQNNLLAPESDNAFSISLDSNGVSLEKQDGKAGKKRSRTRENQKKEDTPSSGLPSDTPSEVGRLASLESSILSSELTNNHWTELKLNDIEDLNASLYDEIEYHCGCCPIELVNFQTAYDHHKSFEHNNFSVYKHPFTEKIQCHCCEDNEIPNLHIILINKRKLGIVCKTCLENAGLDHLIHSFSSNDTFFKYVDHMYRLASLKCFNCESKDTLCIDEDLTCYCGKCIDPASKSIQQNRPQFLAKVFEDESYNTFKNVVYLKDHEGADKFEASSDENIDITSNTSALGLNKILERTSDSLDQDKNSRNNQKASEKSTKKSKKEENKAKKSEKVKQESDKRNLSGTSKQAAERVDGSKNSGKKGDKGLNDDKSNENKLNKKEKLNKASKSEAKGAEKGKLEKQKSSSAKNKKELAASSVSAGKSLAFTNLEGFGSEAVLQDKFTRLKNTIKATLPTGEKLTFNDLSEYYNHLTYSLLLEELYAQDICADVEFDWIDEKSCTMTGSTQVWFDMYVNTDVHHLKKQPFVKEQPIFIFRKSDSHLEWTTIPEFWVVFVSGNTLQSVGRRGKITKTRRVTTNKNKLQSTFALKSYEWNSSNLPIKENGDNFVFLPGSNVLGRVLNSMKTIENKNFINLMLGKQKIKQIKFNNVLKKHYNVLNSSQKGALQSVLNNPVTILQGPPGSGKTSTIYEIILQLLTELSYYPILVVAASNLAVDNIAEKLMPKYKDKIVRITSLSKEKEYNMDHPLGSVCLHNIISKSLPPNIKLIEQNLRKNASSVSFKQFRKYLDTCSRLSSQYVKQANIIFSTTVGIAGPHLKNLEKLPVIIMDEATQSSEPSTLIPFGAKGCTKIVLVGDTAQLSVFTRVPTLEMSLFERVLTNGTYTGDHMLDTQYRMHPDISNFPRNKFYGNKLKDGITAEQRIMPNIKYPVYFFDHQGIGASESKLFSAAGEEYGFSWVNRKEVTYIERMIEKLVFEYKIPPSTIGVMTGYAAQRDLIVKALEKNSIINPKGVQTSSTVDKEDLSDKKNVTVCNVNGIIIASVDAFQGREMNVVLLSCVRSNPQGNIGFMSDKRRMNVAMTRAKYSFILCGDAKCFSSNPLWKDYISQLSDKGYVKKSIDEY